MPLSVANAPYWFDDQSVRAFVRASHVPAVNLENGGVFSTGAFVPAGNSPVFSDFSRNAGERLEFELQDVAPTVSWRDVRFSRLTASGGQLSESLLGADCRK